MPAGTHRTLGVAHAEAGEDERIEQFTLASMQLFGGAGELVVVDRERVGGRRGVVVVALVVDAVVPRCARDPCADVLVHGVELGEQVEAVGDQATTEIAVAIIMVG